MCENCPAAVISLAKRLASYIKAAGYTVEGSLHCVLEDESIADEFITHGLEEDYQWELLAKYELRTDAETVGIGRELLKLTVPERHQVIRMAWDSPNMQPWNEEY